MILLLIVGTSVAVVFVLLAQQYERGRPERRAWRMALMGHRRTSFPWRWQLFMLLLIVCVLLAVAVVV